MAASRTTPISKKLKGIIMLTTSAALLLACGAFAAYEVFAVRQGMLNQASLLTQVIESNSTAALSFNDPRSAGETLASLRSETRVIAARIYSKDGTPFATYVRDSTGRKSLPDSAPQENRSLTRDGLLVAHKI